MHDLIADHRRMISEAKDRLQLSLSKETDVTETARAIEVRRLHCVLPFGLGCCSHTARRR